MADANRDTVVELDLYAEARDDNAWYYGCADAAVGMRGIDYGSMQASMGGSVEDEQRHDARILAPLALEHRQGLWRRAWVETVTSAIPPEHVRTLRVAYTPVTYAWELPCRKCDGRPKAGRVVPFPVVTDDLDTAYVVRDETCRNCGGTGIEPNRAAHKKYAPLDRWEAELREALWIVRYAHKGADKARFPTHAVCLIELAIQAGVITRVAESVPAWAAAREGLGSPSRSELLAFLRSVAEDALPDNTNGRGQKARQLVQTIRSLAGNVLTPALKAYADAAKEADQALRARAMSLTERGRWEDARIAHTEAARLYRLCYVAQQRGDMATCAVLYDMAKREAAAARVETHATLRQRAAARVGRMLEAAGV